MPAPDFTQYTPSGTVGASTALLAANQLAQGNDIRTQKQQTLGEMNTTFTQETMPQLQSGIASTGQWYGTARQKAEGTAQRHFKDAATGVNLAASRALDDLTRQQSYATLGLIL